MSETANEPSNPSRDSAQPASFLERKRAELQNERGIVNDPPPVAPKQVELDMGISQPAQQAELSVAGPLIADEQAPVVEEPDLELQNNPEEGTNSDDLAESNDSEEADIDWRTRSNEFEEKANTATAMHESMQKDYTQKTQLLAEQRRRLEQDISVNEGVLQTYVDNAGTYAAKWDNVNWNQLQNQLDPAAYQQRVGEYRQAVNLRDRALSQHQDFVNVAKETMSRQKDNEAEVSRDILKATIPNWGNDLYAKIGEFAAEKLGFSAEQFSEITDHRVINLIYKDYASRDPQSAVQNISKKSQRTNQTRNAPRRDDKGRFNNLERTRRENPGDRNLTRKSFEERLRRERQDR